MYIVLDVVGVSTKVPIMATDDGKQIRIQILDMAAKDGAGPGGQAVAVARERLPEVAAIGRGQGAEALLVCTTRPLRPEDRHATQLKN